MSATGAKLANHAAAKEVTIVAGVCPNKNIPLPLPPNKEASCGANLGLNFPPTFQLSDKKAAVAEIFYRMRDQACQGLCASVAGVPSDLTAAQRQGDNGCEFAVKLSATKEAYFYATGSGQNCYDATQRMIDSCMVDKNDGKPIHEASWINGPNYGESSFIF
jgi:hypothetical protein